MILKKRFFLVVSALLVFSWAGVLRADTVVSKADKVVIQTYIGEKKDVRGYLSKGERATIFNKTTYTVTMDGLEGPWYFIQTSTGTTGWVFGGSLTFETSASDFKLVDVQKITDGSNGVSHFEISPDGNLVAYTEEAPSLGPNIYYIFVYDTKAKTNKGQPLLSTQYLVGPFFGGLGWKGDNTLLIFTHNGVDKSYQIECALNGGAGLPVTEHPFWEKGLSSKNIERLNYMYRKDPDVLKDLKKVSPSSRQLPDEFSVGENNGKFFACDWNDGSPGRRFIPEIRILDLNDNSVSSVPFWVSRASAPWSGLLDKPGFATIGSQTLVYYPKGDDATLSVDRVWGKSVEHLFDISGPVVRFLGAYIRDDIFYVSVSLPYRPDTPIKLYKYSAGKPLKLVVRPEDSWTGCSFSPDGRRVVYSKAIDGKKALFTATVKE